MSPSAKSTEKPTPAKPARTGKSTRAAKSTAPAPMSAMPEGPIDWAVPGLKERYASTVREELRRTFAYGNVMQVPRVEKVTLNIGMGEAIGNGKAMDAAAADLAAVTGQRPIVTRSRKAISNFRLRVGMPIGLKVTLRGDRMWHFLEKLLTVALPRIRDFQGVPDKSFDGRGNYSLGLKEQLVFPEIEYDRIDRLRGLEVTIVTTAKTDEEGRALLRHLGMPFRTAAEGAGR